MATKPIFDDGDCPEPEHCGNDCRGTYDEDSGEWDEPFECVHCFCCGCNSCSYARYA